MATLHEDLLNDFVDSDVENSDVQDNGSEDEAATASEGDSEDREEAIRHGGSDVQSVANFLKTLQPLLEKVSYYQNRPSTKFSTVEEDPEYKVLTESNDLSTKIDSEIVIAHKFIRDQYATRFPELETLVTNPIDYAKTVAILQNKPLDDIRSISETSQNPVGASLRSVLNGPTLMTVGIEGTTTKGQVLNEEDLEITLKACDMVLQLDGAKKILSDYVQSRMNTFAPNLTVLIGSVTAAQLLNQAGGLRNLAKTPDRNIPAMGSKRTRQAGMASNVGIRNQGFLHQSEIMQEIPNDFKVQAMRIISAKLVLAARIDSLHQYPDGSMGQEFKEQCLHRLDKLTEAPLNRGAKALPAPDDKPARKRGGRRARLAKKATAMTDLRKQQNRMVFGKEERETGYGTGDGTVGLGMIGAENDGRIRATQIDRRTAAKLSKKNPGWGGSGTATSLNNGLSTSLKGFGGNATALRASGLRTSGINNAAAGTASSLAFGGVQGLELVDPKLQAELKRKREAENAGYFSSGTFTQVDSGKGHSSDFKVPQLPAIRKLKNAT